MWLLLAACADPEKATGVTPEPWECAAPASAVTLTEPGWALVDTTDDVVDRGPGSGVLVADVDEDGDDDVVIGLRTGGFFLHRNRGDGFDVEDLGFPGPGLVAALLDLDEDGRLDLLLAGQPDPDVPTGAVWPWLGDGAGHFAAAPAPLVGDIHAVLGISATDYDGDGHVDLYITDSFTDRLLHGLGGGTFEDVSDAAGLPSLAQYSWGAVWVDPDDDGDDDLLLTNDLQGTGGPDSQLLVNEAGAFTASPVGTAFVNSMGAIAFDADGDGTRDAFVSGTGPNGLYASSPMGFIDISQSTGAIGPNGLGRMSLGATAIDLDVDGDTDILTACGRAGLEDLLAVQDPIEPDLYLRNDDGHYTEAAASIGFGDDGDGRTLVAGFLTPDGTPDLVLGQQGIPSRVYQSTCTGAPALLVSLRGTTDNRDGIGAHVILHTSGGDRHAWIEVNAGLGGQQAPRAFFGLGAEEATSVEVRWPSGDLQEVALAPGASGRLRITQGE